MDRKIKGILFDIEKNYNIEILYATEVGSRIWGYSLDKSDFDIKFIYKYKLKDYLNVKPPLEVIDISKDSQFEIHGWDIMKTLRLFMKSNPSLYELLFSPERYIETDFSLQLRELIYKYYSFKRLGYHYYNLAKANFSKKEKGEKDFIHMIRGLLTILFMKQKDKLPPLNMYHLINNVNIPNDLKNESYTLLSRKYDKSNLNQLDTLISTLLLEAEEMITYFKDKDMEIEDINYLIWAEFNILDFQ